MNDIERERLEEFAEKTLSLEDKEMQLTGHTCDIGDSTRNIDLSVNRAKTVERFLTEKGIRQDHISSKGEGWNEPLVPNDTEAQRQQNRRVEIQVEGVQKERDEVAKKSEAEEPETLLPISKLYKKQKQAYQSYCIEPGVNTAIEGSRGTIVVFPEDIFSDFIGSCGECVEIKLKERYNRNEMMMENLGTRTENEMLVSDGMVKVNAFCESDSDTIQSDREILMLFPTEDADEEMSIFSGDRDQQGNMVWDEDSEDDVQGIGRGTFASACGVDDEDCPFFFCKIINFFKGIFGPEEDQEEPEPSSIVSGDFQASLCECIRGRGGGMAPDFYTGAGNLGWNNIDKYLKDRDPVAIYVEDTFNTNVAYKIVLGDERAWVPFRKNPRSSNDEEGYLLGIAPEGMDANIIGIKNYEDDMVGYSEKQVNVERNMSIQPSEYGKISQDEFERRIKELN